MSENDLENWITGKGELEPSSEQVSEESKLALQEQLNFNNFPGNHTKKSPVVERRLAEIDRLMSVAELQMELFNFEKALYLKENVYLIPVAKKEEAEKVAREIFLDYIDKYREGGIDERNIVCWKQTGMAGAATNKTWVHDLENQWNTWRVQVLVEDGDNIVGDKFLPKYLVAYHEVMHLEETPKGSSRSIQQKPGRELLATLKTIMLADQINKKVSGIPIDTTVDYGTDVIWGNQKVQLGRIANFYRNLENRYGNLAAAVASSESIDFIRGGL